MNLHSSFNFDIEDKLLHQRFFFVVGVHHIFGQIFDKEFEDESLEANTQKMLNLPSDYLAL